MFTPAPLAAMLRRQGQRAAGRGQGRLTLGYIENYSAGNTTGLAIAHLLFVCLTNLTSTPPPDWP